MKKTIPVFAFSAWSGTGKTTLLEKLIPSLKQHGLQVAVIKHDAHDFEIDQEGKDSWRFTKAGADLTVISSAKKTALIEQRSLSLPEILSRIPDADMILLEGYNQEDLPGLHRIGISRKDTGKGFRLPLRQYCALVTEEYPDTDLPCYSPDDIEGLTDFLCSFL